MSVQYFKDAEKTIMNPELLDKTAREKAKQFFDTDNRGRTIYVSSHQLRKFYNEVKNLEKKLKVNDWDIIYPMVKMIKSKIAYATSDSKIKNTERKLYRKFKDFLVEGIDSIQDQKDFHAFCKYFEAVVGYYYGEGGK
jgi:CRISPR type III-A-associated protein Csm2